MQEQLSVLDEIGTLVKNTKKPLKAIQSLMEENSKLQKQMESLQAQQAVSVKQDLKNKVEDFNGVNFLSAKVNLDAGQIKNLCFQLKGEIDNLFLILGTAQNGKPNLQIAISEELAKAKDLNAGRIIRELAKEIKGGGGGQPFYASAGGGDASGLDRALERAKEFIG